LFDSGILLIIDLNREKEGGGGILFVNLKTNNDLQIRQKNKQ
jgi:hypothetical protein